MDTTGRHPSTVQAVRGFAYDHLPEHLQEVSRPFHDLAQDLLDRLPDDPELSASLRKLREAKDCAVLLAAVVRSDAGGE
ncbi:hypothetical protein ACFWVT_05760 [Streptomyces cyaneofuscatus]|uniref:hypothetical protein n=1 Tax=Streptomyces cyaneofuscatus TaxID=66883 RepID=UPI003647EE38